MRIGKNEINYGKMFLVVLGAILVAMGVMILIVYLILSPYLSQLSSIGDMWSQIPSTTLQLPSVI